MCVGEIDLQDMLRLVLVIGNDFLQDLDSPTGERRLVFDRICDALLEDMNLLLALVLGSVVDFAKRGCTRLLINRHDFPPKKGVDERRLARVEVAGDEDFGGSILRAETESIKMR